MHKKFLRTAMFLSAISIHTLGEYANAMPFYTADELEKINRDYRRSYEKAYPTLRQIQGQLQTERKIKHTATMRINQKPPSWSNYKGKHYDPNYKPVFKKN